MPASPSRTRREHRRPRPRPQGRLRPVEDKRRYRQYKARTQQLPANHHTAIDALQRYTESFRPGKADSLLMLADLADLFEQSAANATPIREVVGEDPVQFAEAFLRTYRRVSGSTVSGNGRPTASSASRATNRDQREKGHPDDSQSDSGACDPRAGP
ncbi:DUF1048 domain-containing protein [Streptosporangium sp. NBC_01755]|uniref:DUF1048 domain-containing protein n=1 Tax=unclassified Streptosporangium TaxID=2632669 RepID=UPI002DD85108|nr:MULTISPECIES: DUF1048 domain-containing protein [unclassified Streptosporangium]WSA28672.1 DUF1048 domain-containing protein [Streptosporangium sp. NBC_01810]WSC99875.1 DUF1048 domain-containing protein [Streptosporangium sp. NBC_01755]